MTNQNCHPTTSEPNFGAYCKADERSLDLSNAQANLRPNPSADKFSLNLSYAQANLSTNAVAKRLSILSPLKRGPDSDNTWRIIIQSRYLRLFQFCT